MTAFPTGCDICDTHGPHEAIEQEWFQVHRDLHPAWDTLRTAINEEWARLKAAAALTAEAIERAHRTSPDDYALTGPTEDPR